MAAHEVLISLLDIPAVKTVYDIAPSFYSTINKSATGGLDFGFRMPAVITVCDSAPSFYRTINEKKLYM